MRTRFSALFLLFSLIIVPGALIAAQPENVSSSGSKGIITGKIFIKGGGPLACAAVHFNDDSITPPLYNRVRRPPALTVKTDEEGRFRAELPAGNYSFQVIKRIFKNNAAPLGEGDYVYYGVDGNGKLKTYFVKSGEATDIGIIAEAVPYKKSEDIIRTAIEGLITDTEGKPVEGMIVFALADYMARTKPLYYSIKTAPDGKYILRVPEGSYYLRARNKLKGGTPEPGTHVGMHGGQTPVPVTVKDGEIKNGINITVMKIPERGPGARGPEMRPPQ